MIRSKYIAVCAVWLVWAGATLFPATARAQDQAVIDKLVQMNKKALDDYDTLDWESAKKRLLDALMTGKKAGLDNHPVLARTYIHLGAVYLTGFKDRQKALQSFSRALDIDPTIQLSKGIESPDVSAAFQEAQRSHGVTSAPAAAAPSKAKRRGPVMESESEAPALPAPRRAPTPPPPEDDEGKEPDLPVHVAALDCPTPDEAIIDKALLLRCAVAPSLPVASVWLLYRAPGKDGYTEEVMTKSPKGWLQATIPKKAVTGKSMQFYFEGRNSTGKPVVANGGADAPNIVLLVEESARGEASAAPPVEEDENPLVEDEGPYHPRLRLGHVDKEREGLDTRYGKRKWWIGIGLGTGYGYAKGNGFEAVNKSPDPYFHSLSSEFTPGLAWAGLGHLAPEVGYAFNPDIAISLEGRLQYIPQSGEFANYAAKGAISVLAKLSFYTKQSQLRFFGSVLAGGGEGFRFIVYPADGQPAVDNFDYSKFKDTILGGPVVAGLGGGIYYELSKPVSVVGEIHGLVGFPTVSAVMDFQAAIQFNIY
ncbi:MAG TPA: tetratricopeptide repeat protein [Polyangia bacterium]|nr:tetratricopeptide repeat protein [Polyangia bacterium]